LSDDKISVILNDKEIRLHRGMKVKHALIALDQSLLASVEAGDLEVRDADGFAVGLEGGLHDGARLFTTGPRD
jgi:hypothetical protein